MNMAESQMQDKHKIISGMMRKLLPLASACMESFYPRQTEDAIVPEETQSIKFTPRPI